MSLRKTFSSTIGAKTLMAITGLLLLGFVIGHLVGNLQVFAGREKLNDYAEFLKNSGPLLWGTRIGLLAIVAVHLGAALRLKARSRAARPIPYVMVTPQKTTLAARTMLMSGLVILAFVVYHLLHFTVGTLWPAEYHLTEQVIRPVLVSGAPQLETYSRHDVYGMVIAGFKNPWIVLSYVVAQILLALHLSHGVSSAFQTLGVSHPALAFLKSRLGPTLAVLIFVGYVSIPMSILLGVVK